MNSKKDSFQSDENVRVVIQVKYINLLGFFQKNMQSLGKLREKNYIPHSLK